MDQSAVVQAAAGGFDHGVGGGIEVRVIVVALEIRRRELPPHSHVHREFRSHSVIVLEIERVHELPQIDDRIAAEVDGVGKPEIEIRQAVAGRIAGDRAGRRLAQLRAGGLAERSGVRVLTIQRIGVQDLGVDRQILKTHLEGMPVPLLREVEFGIPGSGVLKLRIAGLAAHGGEPGDGLSIESAGEVGCRGQALKATVLTLHTGATHVRRFLAAQDMGEAHTGFQDRGRGDGPGIPGRSVLIDDVNVAVAVAAGGPGEVGRVILQVFALAPAEESRHAIVDLAVEFGVVFVAVIVDQQQCFVVVGTPGAVGRRQLTKDRGSEGIQLGDRDLRVRRVNGAGQRVDHGHR